MSFYLTFNCSIVLLLLSTDNKFSPENYAECISLFLKLLYLFLESMIISSNFES